MLLVGLVFSRGKTKTEGAIVRVQPTSLESLLQGAARELGMTGATYMRKEFENSLVVEGVVMLHTIPGARAPFHLGQRLDPWLVFCGKVLERSGPLVVDNSSLNSWRNHVASFRYGMERYVGAPVMRDGEILGVVGFFDLHASTQPMGNREKEFAQSVAHDLLKFLGPKRENSVVIPEVESDFRIAA